MTKTKTISEPFSWVQDALKPVGPEHEDQHEDPVEQALQALDMLDEYDVDIRATARVGGSIKVTAKDMESACKKVLAMDLSDGDIDYQFEDNSDLEGDYIAYVSDGSMEGARVELNLSSTGEPYSWDAVAIVKMLATIDGPTVDHIEQLTELIRQARIACGKDK
jgi:hypothetical protein